MIDINLIPVALRKDGPEDASLAINIPKEVLMGVWIGVFLLLAMVHLVFGALWWTGMGRLTACKAQWQQVLPDKKAMDDMKARAKDLKKQIDMISDMTVKKSVLWAPKFNAISDALPRGLWIRQMTLDKTSLVLEGSVVSKTESEINNVGLFLSTLKQNDDFMKGFSSLEVNSIQRSKDSTVEVTDFTVMAKLNETKLK